MDEVSVKSLLHEIVREDERSGDLTRHIVPEKNITAEIICKQAGVIAGIAEAKLLFEEYGAECEVLVEDGVKVSGRAVLLRVTGLARRILLVERSALNLLSFMSGIATCTREYADAAQGVRIAATRKTTPLFRWFEKKAVMVGGGLMHRFGLDDLFIIKDNHLTLYESISEPIKLAKKDLYHKVEVEVKDFDGAKEAAKAGADIIMLDNMDCESICEVVDWLEKEGLRGRIVLEASGNIVLGTLADYAKTGVDVISTSAMNQAPGLDVSLKFLESLD